MIGIANMIEEDSLATQLPFELVSEYYSDRLEEMIIEVEVSQEEASLIRDLIQQIRVLTTDNAEMLLVAFIDGNFVGADIIRRLEELWEHARGIPLNLTVNQDDVLFQEEDVNPSYDHNLLLLNFEEEDNVVGSQNTTQGENYFVSEAASNNTQYILYCSNFKYDNLIEGLFETKISLDVEQYKSLKDSAFVFEEYNILEGIVLIAMLGIIYDFEAVSILDL